MSKPQSASSHAKMVPMYHYVTFLLLLVPILYFVVQTVLDFSATHLMLTSLAAGALIGVLFARIFPLGVQDRVIRLEERLRLADQLPAELHPRINEISTDLLIGLRFASDDELEGLTRKILDGELDSRKSVKNAIGTWRPDHQRI